MAEPTTRTNFREIGSSGLKQQGGSLNEEFLRELHGSRGVEIYREMSLNDPVAGAILFAMELMIGQVEWTIEPFSDDNADQPPKEFVEQALFEDMSQSWPDTLSEICTMFTYGFAWMEVVFKMRKGPTPGGDLPKSKFTDSRIGWRKWALRGQNTLSKWVIDESGGIKGMEQYVDWPNSKTVIVPIEKSLLFRTRVERNSPEGLSLLRRAYRPWFYLKRMQEIEAIGIERDLAGLPILRPPAGLDIWNTNDGDMVQLKTAAEDLVRSVRRGQQEGVLLPGGESEFARWNLELLSSPSRRQFNIDATIQRYEVRIAMSCLADFLFLGQGQSGSWALSTDKTELFTIALGGFLKRITEVINRHAIPNLLELNPFFDASRPPKLAHGDIDTPNLAELAAYLSALTDAGASLFPDESLDRHIRRIAHLPPPSEEPLPNATPIEKRKLREFVHDLIISGRLKKLSGANGNLD